jgi:opacity protein-like surface antigen
MPSPTLLGRAVVSGLLTGGLYFRVREFTSLLVTFGITGTAMKGSVELLGVENPLRSADKELAATG